MSLGVADPPLPLREASQGDQREREHVARWRRTAAKVVRRLRSANPLEYLLGLWLRTRFQRAGLVVVRAGWPLPHVENRGGRIEVQNCAFFSGVRLECWPGAVIRIGNGTYLNRNVEIVAAGAVSVGRDCMIARDVIIMDTDQHALSGTGLVVKPVEIGDRVWIGARAIILKGVRVGHDSVVGAGAVLTKSVPPYSVVASPAATVIRSLAPEGPAGEPGAGPAAPPTR
ncbi:MAG TPA: acyltransferase [Chloroflexota bacterium]|nr:acyltransferase [Chloroflexota bacterium]